MSMTVYTASVYVVSKETNAFFELSFDNEMCPELAIKDSIDAFIDDFTQSNDRSELISKAFDANYNWEGEDPYYLAKEVDSASDFDTSIAREYKKFCKDIQKMKEVEYVVFAVDSNKKYWLDYATYWYDAMVFDFGQRKLLSVGWRGTELKDDDNYWDYKPFYKSTAEYLIKMIKAGKADLIDTGDFMHNGKKAGNVNVREIAGTGAAVKEPLGKTAPGETEEEEAKQLERLVSLIKIVESIDFAGKAFVFDRLDYVPVNGEFAGPDSPNNPIVKKVIETGGVMRKKVSGKTDYLVIDDQALMRGMSSKCKGALEQVDKGKNITIITVSNLLKVLGK